MTYLLRLFAMQAMFSPHFKKAKAFEDVPGHSITAHNVTVAGIFKRFFNNANFHLAMLGVICLLGY